MESGRLVFLGTSHIARQSLNEVTTYINENNPDIIALELDEKRLNALMSRTKRKTQLKDIWRIGLKGFLFYIIGAWAERKLGEIAGIAPGSEMKLAIRMARKQNIQIALIDQDIEITLRRLTQSITWREKSNFLLDLLKAPFSRKQDIQFDLAAVPDKGIITALMKKVKERYPNFYKVLVEERNHVIAHKLIKLRNMNPNSRILVILGAGHVDEVAKLSQD
jgi:pheromone shutdown-related protein TraB